MYLRFPINVRIGRGTHVFVDRLCGDSSSVLHARYRNDESISLKLVNGTTHFAVISTRRPTSSTGARYFELLTAIARVVRSGDGRVRSFHRKPLKCTTTISRQFRTILFRREFRPVTRVFCRDKSIQKYIHLCQRS